MYDTPLTRPTTVGGLLGNALKGTGQVAQAGGGVPLQNYLLGLLGPRSLEMLAARRTSTPATTMIAPSPVGLLTPEMMSTQAPVGFDYVSPAPQLTKDQEARYSNYLLDNKVRDRLSQKTSALDEIERQSTPAPSLLGRIGGGIRSAGKELGGLFEGDEGRARAAALSRSLLRGPSRTPISFGQSLAEGLAAGGEEIERMEQRKVAKEQRARQKKQIQAQDKLADVLADPEATDTEKKSAFKAAYPVEAFKAEGKPVDLVKQIGTIAIGKLLKKPPEPLSPVEQDAYNKLMSAGGFDLFAEAKKRSEMIDEPDSAQPRDTRVLGTPAQQQAREELERRRRQREER